MLLISQLVKQKLEEGYKQNDLQDFFSISRSMVTAYKKGENNPSLEVAVGVFLRHGITLHPFAEESLQYEIDKMKKGK